MAQNDVQVQGGPPPKKTYAKGGGRPPSPCKYRDKLFELKKGEWFYIEAKDWYVARYRLYHLKKKNTVSDFRIYKISDGRGVVVKD